jgi:cell division protein FtsW (lipid II flippase)
METYNKIMQFFWLAMAVVIGVSVTYMSITEGFEKWAFNYVFAALALFVFLIRRYMMNRMKKHQEFLNNQQNKK